MIVNQAHDGHHIIPHAAHGLLCGKIALQIAEPHRSEHWFDTIIAITLHDDCQAAIGDKKYLSDIGLPLDFTDDQENIRHILNRCKQLLEATHKKSRWVTVLISYHLDFIYGHHASRSKMLTDYLKNLAQQREALTKALECSKKDIEHAYDILLFCDRLSLILCKDEVPALGRSLEINQTINGDTYFIRQKDDQSLTVEPWIFTHSSFTVSVEEFLLKKGSFSSEKELRESMDTLDRNRLQWIFTQ